MFSRFSLFQPQIGIAWRLQHPSDSLVNEYGETINSHGPVNMLYFRWRCDGIDAAKNAYFHWAPISDNTSRNNARRLAYSRVMVGRKEVNRNTRGIQILYTIDACILADFAEETSPVALCTESVQTPLPFQDSFLAYRPAFSWRPFPVAFDILSDSDILLPDTDGRIVPPCVPLVPAGIDHDNTNA